MSEYRTVEGELGAINVLTNLTTFGGETGVGPIKVPANSSRLVELWIAISLQVDTDTDRVGAVLRLSGKGMAQGDQDFPLMSGFHEGTGAEVGNSPAIIYSVDMSVTPNENINVAAAGVGDTEPRGHVQVGMVFA